MSVEYQQGRDAYNAGKNVDDCPYDIGSAYWRAWSDGWQAELLDDDVSFWDRVDGGG